MSVCDVCGWSDDQSGARWCGRCGAALSDGSDGSEFVRPKSTWRNRAAWATGVLAAVSVGVVVFSGWLTPDGGIDGRRRVDLPDPAAVDGAGGGAGGLRCRPADCAVWRDEDRNFGAVTVDRDLVLHADRDDLAALAVDSGERLWSQALPGADRSDAGTVAAMAIGRNEVAVAYDSDGDHPASVLGFDASSGAPRFERAFPAVSDIHGLTWIDRTLVVMGTAPTEGDDPRPTMVFAISNGGEVLWEADGYHRIAGDVLVRIEEGTVTAVSPHDGTNSWAHEIPDDAGVDFTPGMALVHDSRRVVVLDVRDGSPTTTVELEGLLGAGFAGPWLIAETAGTWHLLDPADGSLLFTRPLGDPDVVVRTDAIQLRDEVVMAWPAPETSGAIELVRYRADGTEIERWTVPLPDGPSGVGPWRLSMAGQGEQVVQLTSDLGRQSIWFSLDRGQVVRTLNLAEAERANVQFRAGLIISRQNAVMQVHGPSGSVSIEGADRVAYTDPLIAHGPAGILRVDEGAVMSEE